MCGRCSPPQLRRDVGVFSCDYKDYNIVQPDVSVFFKYVFVITKYLYLSTVSSVFVSGVKENEC